jgi:hypothetical protein
MSVSINGSSSVTINSGAVLGITSGTAQASTSGTSIDFTSIPSWVKRITVMLNGVSNNTGSNLLFQLGSGSITTTGYSQLGWFIQTSTSNATVTSSAGILNIATASATSNHTGIATICLVSGNTWVASATTSQPATSNTIAGSSGSITLGGTLDRVRITTVNGTDTFDAGSINILYE